MLSNYLNEYKLSKPNEFLIPPKPLERGNLTAKDVFNATTSELCLELVKKWASEVYNSWHSNHLLVSDIGIGFLSVNKLK